MDEATAFKTWEFDNSIALTSTHLDAIYDYPAAAQATLHADQPWRQNPHYFARVRISAVALLKMVMHARSGGSLEVMGLMQGHIVSDTFVVTDAFRLPVEGTETRVNAQEEANEYMPAYLAASRDAGQPENAVGWYHSHPGYGCWLSGIDVSTQMTQQTFQDPFLAVVIDPDRTVSAGKVEIGAFRTYPENYTPPATTTTTTTGAGDEEGYQTIPLAKMEDFGAHAARYYPLEISHFKSSLDAKLLAQLWNKYWVATLSGNPLLSNRDYTSMLMGDLAQKVWQAVDENRAEGKGASAGGAGRGVGGASDPGAAPGGKDGKQLEKVVRDGNKIAAEEVGGLIAAGVKARLFNGVGQVAGRK